MPLLGGVIFGSVLSFLFTIATLMVASQRFHHHMNFWHVYLFWFLWFVCGVIAGVIRG